MTVNKWYNVLKTINNRRTKGLPSKNLPNLLWIWIHTWILFIIQAPQTLSLPKQMWKICEVTKQKLSPIFLFLARAAATPKRLPKDRPIPLSLIPTHERAFSQWIPTRWNNPITHTQKSCPKEDEWHNDW